jgi:GAF domain-containing protein
VHGTVAGEIDIDSHDLAAFSAQDREFLEECAAIVGHFMERTQAVSSDAK